MIEAGWLSILPPLIAIILALKTKEVYSSLFAGVFAGMLIYCFKTVNQHTGKYSGKKRGIHFLCFECQNNGNQRRQNGKPACFNHLNSHKKPSFVYFLQVLLGNSFLSSSASKGRTFRC